VAEFTLVGKTIIYMHTFYMYPQVGFLLGDELAEVTEPFPGFRN
jgi:hypothetical protein